MRRSRLVSTGAVTAATLTSDVSRVTVFSYEAGTGMITGTAPARRVGFFPTNGTGSTTGAAAQLFDAAVAWEANTTPIVSYVRDASDRFVARKINGTIVAKYSYTATGDAADITLDAAGTVVEATTVLTGGALWTSRPGGSDVWSYPNIHGDLTATANSAGVKQGATRVFDPYGNPLGTTTIPDNSTGGMDYGWHGSQQRPLENQPGVLPVIEMGARQYSPTLGRFLEIDPIEGGVDNDYTYPTDPVNNSDLDGLFVKCSWCRKQWNRHRNRLVNLATTAAAAVVTASCLGLTAGAGSVACVAAGVGIVYMGSVSAHAMVATPSERRRSNFGLALLEKPLLPITKGIVCGVTFGSGCGGAIIRRSLGRSAMKAGFPRGPARSRIERG